ncbi:hypothetical protein Lal_00013343 [Lupinus albus]|uniref:Putative pectinesterase inhibitor domain-containing protein n=1 Tax=Lupinus albus TaxID=3870 RepID=A0A6A4P0G2_LUPAL|nr:putative pectinesterase inhibitor domain-containing protein [Lupinus albus]KAF1890748.1 hypothetical protein Lal_00013343 [Lupinus albus]
MKLTNQIFFSTILLCFALVGKCVDGTPKILAPLLSSSSPSPTPSPTPSSSEERKIKTSSSYFPKQPTTQFSDTPSTAGSPSTAPTPSTDGSFSEYLKGKFGDNSKIKYNPGLEQICGKTHHPDVCLATVSPLLKNKVDVVHTLQAAIAVATQNVKMIISNIEKQYPSVSGEAAASLTDCKNHYNKALGNLQKAMQSVQTRDFGSVTKLLSGVVADVSSAESKIQDLKTSPFNADKFHSLVTATATNCLSIASLIRN